MQTAARALQEYQFLQDQPNLRSDSYGQGAQSHHHDSPLDGPRARASSIGLANEPQSKVHGAHVHVSRVRVLSQQEKAGHISSSAHGSDGIPAEMEPFVNNRIHASPSTRPTSGPEDPYVLSNGQNLNSDHDLRIDRKRKVYIMLNISKKSLAFCFMCYLCYLAEECVLYALFILAE